tara:strand:+ start:482 stop:694 length:213 start_codon:yes stop_codon:yes gene_type:complete
MHVFVLTVSRGYGDARSLAVNDLYFYQLNVCNKVAKALVERYSTHGITTADRAVAYCLPVKITDDSLHVY